MLFYFGRCKLYRNKVKSAQILQRCGKPIDKRRQLLYNTFIRKTEGVVSISHTYSIEYLGREIGNIISAPYSLAIGEYTEQKTILGLGKYIWYQNYTRGHYRRNITLEAAPERVLAEFVCDNRFALYVNGNCVYDSIDFFAIGERIATGVLDLTEHFTDGENKIAIVARQSGSHDRFLSAMRGGFEITCNGKKELIGTDESFRFVWVCGFWDDKEDEGWETSDTPRASAPAEVYPIHPHALRRSVYMRKSFEVKEGLEGATLRATAFGLYEPYVNGRVACDDRLLPGAMDGCKEYCELDITAMLKVGRNAVGAILANGWYNCTAYGVLWTKRLGFAAEIILKYRDGEVVIPTDESWLCGLSPLYEDDIQFGERYDARLEVVDWCMPDFNGVGFVNAEVIDLPHKPYALQSYPPIRVTDTPTPQRRWDLGDNRVIFDLGSNNAARGRLTLRKTKRGDKYRIRYAERLKDGEPHLGVYGDVYYISDTFRGGSAKGAQRNCDSYICRGADVEVYEPRFAYTGFRYIYVEYPEGANPEDISVKAMVLHNDLAVCGEIKTSYEPLFHIWEMICRTFDSNTVGGPTDCPTREKNFWNGDIQAFCYTAMWYKDVNDYLCRWTHMGRKIEYNVYGWEDEEYVLPYKLYKFYGNRDILEAKYETMLALIDKRQRYFEENGTFPPRSARYRDHLSLVNVSHDFFAYCWHTYMYKAVSEISDILGNKDKAKELMGRFLELREKFNEIYFEKDTHDYSEHCQGGIILPIMLGLAKEEEIPSLVERLVEYLKTDKGPTTGFFTTESLLLLLSEYGYTDLAHDIMTRDTFPSWLYLWKTGSTTITESWHGEAAPYDESMNHYAFGSVGRYFFEALGGLAGHSGDMRHFEIKPEICEKIGDFGVSYRTPHGVVSTFWRVSEGKGSLEVVLPDGVDATVTLPDGRVLGITASETFDFLLKG